MTGTVVAIVRPNPNLALVESLEKLLAQAKSGEVTGFIAVKFRWDHSFAVEKVGDISNLQLAGALAFAQYDLIVSNVPLPEGA